MTKNKNIKKSLLASIVALLICISMLIGTTFAWFTDVVESGNNIIKSGNLDIEMYWTKDLSTDDWTNVENPFAEPVFSYDRWEPGYTEVRYIKIVNAGNLAFKYYLSIIPDGAVGIIADVIDVYFYENVNQNIDSRDDLAAQNHAGTLRQAIDGEVSGRGILLPAGESEAGLYSGEIVVAIALKMQESADNKYMNQSIGDSFSLQLLATQYTYEDDSFGSDFDTEAILPTPTLTESTSADVTPDENNKIPAGGAEINGGSSNAKLPEGVQLEAGTNKVTLNVSNLDNSSANVTLGANDAQKTLDVEIEGVSHDNTVPIEIALKEAAPKGLNAGNLKIYHVEDGVSNQMTYVASTDAFTAHNQFKYDPATGDVILYMATFSPVALVNDTVNEWGGEYDYSWFDPTNDEFNIANADQLAGFGAIVGGMAKDKTGAYVYTATNDEGEEYHRFDFNGKTVKLLSDINLGDKETENKEDIIFYPIGYYNNTESYEKISGKFNDAAVYSTVYAFKGTFDGNGNTIKNFYQNTWEMFGDYNTNYANTPNHYKDAMGLFGYVLNGTVKNLTIENFSNDGEFAPTGVIAAYAEGTATFENISLINCNPRTYNTGVGGIVGWDNGGDEADLSDQSKFVFKNITVDATNTISALWGSWDVAAGGILGYLGPKSLATLENCSVSATIDVYNDVCANYQYYWYRYCGMLIGTVDRTDANGKLDLNGITATNCSVNFGDRHQYYYCELVANSLASYTHEHQFSRLTTISDVSDIQDDGGNWEKTGNYIVINGEEKTCYHIIKDENGNLKEHRHEDSGKETVNGVELWKEDTWNQKVYLPFSQLFGGYGWGVNGVSLGNYDGIKVSETTVSEYKFIALADGDHVSNTTTITLGMLFGEIKYKNIVDSRVQVFVSPVGEGSTVTATYKANQQDWREGTLTFSGNGGAKIVITDYDYCLSTTTSITIADPEGDAVEKFETVNGSGFAVEAIEANGKYSTNVTLGDLFAATGKGTINASSLNVTFATEDGIISEIDYLEWDSDAQYDWTMCNINFEGVGTVTVTITDQNNCVATSATVTITEPGIELPWA